MPLFSCGFEAGSKDYYTLTGWDFSPFSFVATDQVHQGFDGEGGSYSMYIDDGVTSPTFASADGRWLHFWVQAEADGSPTWPTLSLQFFEPGTNASNAVVLFGNQGLIQIRRGNNTVVATSTIILNTASAHWVAIYMHADNSGSCEVWFNGALIVSYTGDLQDTATPGWQSVRWSANNQDLYYDDIIVTTEEEGRLDECYIVPLAPDGDDVTALTPSTGVDNFAMVDEVPPSTTDYNETLVTAEDFYDLEALPPAPSAAW